MHDHYTLHKSVRIFLAVWNFRSILLGITFVILTAITIHNRCLFCSTTDNFIHYFYVTNMNKVQFLAFIWIFYVLYLNTWIEFIILILDIKQRTMILFANKAMTNDFQIEIYAPFCSIPEQPITNRMR